MLNDKDFENVSEIANALRNLIKYQKIL